MNYSKPIPMVTDQNREFWEGAKSHKLIMQKCESCKHIRYPINHICPKCLSDKFLWEELSGEGEILSYIVFYQKYSPAFADDIPYNVALIQLKEGPRMFSNIIVADHDVPKVGDKVRVAFDPVTTDITIPRFTLV